jgi:hypothetical protein
MAVIVETDGGADLAFPEGTDMVGVLRHQGEACNPWDACDTGQCVDGYCCDQPCAGNCEACNVPGAPGICTNVANGASPVGERSCNPETAATCGRDGKCDGAGNCRSYPLGTICTPGTCTSSTGDFANPSQVSLVAQ